MHGDPSREDEWLLDGDVRGSLLLCVLLQLSAMGRLWSAEAGNMCTAAILGGVVEGDGAVQGSLAG